MAEVGMVDWLESPGFGDRARREGDATHVPPDAEAKLRAGGDKPWWTNPEAARAAALGAMPEPDADEPSPLFTSVAVAAVAGFIATTWFLLLAMGHAGHWTPAEVTAPLWGLLLLGAAVTLAVGIVLGALDAWDAYCLRRAIRRDRRP